ncbi:MAG: hypothetical protein WC661_15245 [Opitutaceae bacterium]|jgi:hypothetical protein
MSKAPASRRHLREACLAAIVWRRAALLGVPVGVMQATLNQGDHWMAGVFTAAVVAKSILSPCLSFSIAYVSAVLTHAENLQRKPSLLPL